MLEKFAAVGGKLNGHPDNRLVHNLNIGFDGIESKAIINSVSKKIADWFSNTIMIFQKKQL